MLGAATPVLSQLQLVGAPNGRFDLPASMTWSTGPLGPTGQFTIPAFGPNGSRVVLCGTNANIEVFMGGGWVQIFDAADFNTRPRFILPAGTYRFDAFSGAGSIAWGYWAPVAPLSQPGFSEYLEQGRLWHHHVGLSGTPQFTVPSGQTWMLTSITIYSSIEKLVGTVWQPFFHYDGDKELAMPGLPLGPGQYRFAKPAGTIEFVSGYKARV